MQFLNTVGTVVELEILQSLKYIIQSEFFVKFGNKDVFVISSKHLWLNDKTCLRRNKIISRYQIDIVGLYNVDLIQLQRLVAKGNDSETVNSIGFVWHIYF